MQIVSRDVIDKVKELSLKNNELAYQISQTEREIAKRKIKKYDIDYYKNSSMLFFSIIFLFIIILIIALIVDFFSSYDMVISDIITTTIFISCFICYEYYKNNKVVKKLIYYQNLYLKNTENILHLIKIPLKHYIDKSVMVDINSIQENGFYFVDSTYLKIYLQDEIGKGNMELIRLPQKNISLYKTKIDFSEVSDMTTTHLTID